MPSTPPYRLSSVGAAVRLLRRSGRSVPQLAKELGCSPESLRNWAGQVDVDSGKAEGLTSDEREELLQATGSAALGAADLAIVAN